MSHRSRPDAPPKPDVSGVRTRGDLLRRADAAITTAEHRLTSARRTIPVLLWSIGLTVMVFAQSGGDLRSADSDVALIPSMAILWWVVARLVPGRAFVGHVVAAVVVVVVGSATTPVVEDLDASAGEAYFLTVWALLAIGTTWAAWTYIAAGRRLVDEAESWRSARRDHKMRDLDASDVDLDLATVDDVREWDDADAAVHAVAAREAGRQTGLRAVKPVSALTVTGVLGLTFLLAPAVGLDDSRWAAADAVSGFLLMSPWAWAGGVDMVRFICGRQAEVDRSSVEARLHDVRRQAVTGTTGTTRRRASLIATPAGLLLAIAWVAVLVVRLRSSSSLVIAITAAIVLVATIVVVTVAVRRARQTRVFPLAGTGPSVLQAPAREVVLELDDAGLTIADRRGHAHPHTIPLADVVAVEPLTGVSGLSRSGVGIVTRDAPVVLVGRSVTDDPAIVRLRSQLA